MKTFVISLAIIFSLSTFAYSGQYDDKVKTLKNEGVIYKIEKTNALASTVWVGPSFYSLNYDDKNFVLGLIYLNIYPNDKRNMLFLTDSMSGKNIGKFVPLQGGLKLN